MVCKVVYDGIIHCKACVEAGRISKTPALAPPPSPVFAPPPAHYPYTPPRPRDLELTPGTRVLLYLLSVIPVLGLIIGLIYASSSDRDSKSVGGNCLVIGLVSTIFGCLCWMLGGWGALFF